MANEKKMTHEEGMNFLGALIALIYNLVKSIKAGKTPTCQ